MVSFISGTFTSSSVTMSVVATTAATLSLTLYAMISKSDFTKLVDSFYGIINKIT